MSDMTKLSTEHICVMSSYPIGEALDFVRLSFRSTCDKLGMINSSESSERVVLSEDGRYLARRLLIALANQEAAENFPLKGSNTTLSDDLAVTYAQISSAAFKIDWIVPLYTSVISKASDEAIWKAAFDLIAQTKLFRSPNTPSFSRPSVTSALKNTPNHFNTGSYQNTTEPVEEMRKALKGELKSNLELDHSEFIATYFAEIPQVEVAATAVWNRCREGENSLYTIGNKWRDWENDDEEGVQRSVEKCVNTFTKFLDEAGIEPPDQRRFVPSPNTPIPGPVKRKPDLCVATFAEESTGVPAKSNKSIDSWHQILVAGELKSSGKDKWARTWSDVMKLAREIFRHQNSRRFVLGFTLCGSTMRLWEFDRLGATTSEAFDIHENGHLFVKILLSFLWMNNEQLGFDSDLMERDGQRFVKINKDGKEERLIIIKTLKDHAAACIAGRATICWKAYHEEDDSKKSFVVKDSWQYVNRPEEGELIRRATAQGVINISHYYHHETVLFNGRQDDIRSNVRNDMSIGTGSNPLTQPDFSPPDNTTFSKASRVSEVNNSSQGPSSLSMTKSSRASHSPALTKTQCTSSLGSARQKSQTSRKRPASQIEALKPAQKRPRLSMTSRKNDYDRLANNRVHRRIITRNVGKLLFNASCPAAIITGLLGGIKGHESLYRANILHRDISLGNILLEEDESDGFLIDLDLAVDIARQKTSEAPGKTGTKIFMAIGVLEDEPHHFMHDLESFFWVLFWICIHYTGPGEEAQNVRTFKDWNHEPPDKLADLKRGMISNENRFDKKMSDFFTNYCTGLIPCVKELWKVVFPGGKQWETPDDELYSKMKNALEKAKDRLMAEKTG